MKIEWILCPFCGSKTRLKIRNGAAEVGLYEQISRLNNHHPFRIPLMRAVSLNFFGTLSGSYELRFRMGHSRCLDSRCPAPAGFPRCYGSW